MGKTRQDILDACADRMSDVKTFYQAPFINYKGKTSDTKEYFTEVVAEFVYNHINLFQKGILPITRKVSYKTESHIGNVPTSNREEETIAIKMFNQSDKEGFIYPHIGEIIDYQTPLKSSNQDEKTGKIDLLSFDENKKVLHILELKKPDSEETMLRCVLEGYTYMKIVDKEKLMDSFKIPKGTVLMANPFVFKGEGSNPYKEMQQTERVSLRKLMHLLNIIPFYVIENGGKYTVTDK